MRSSYNTVFIAVIAVYVIVTLPVIQQALVLVLGLFVASLICNPNMRDLGYQILGALSRAVHSVLANRKSSQLRSGAMYMCAAIDQYPEYVSTIVNRKRRLFFMLSPLQQKEAARNYRLLQNVESCAAVNAKALQQLKTHAMQVFDVSQRDLWGQKVNVYSCVELIEHLVRDWSDSEHHGTSRKSLFSPLWPHLKNKKRLLVPGSGVGRLPFDIAEYLGSGAVIDALELSPAMHISALYATTRSSEELLEVCPYLLEFSHLKERKDQFSSATVKLPSSTVTTPGLNFHYADFLAFDNGYAYDAIVTLFFIDTAQNIFNYIDRIARMLAPGGVWVNYGPLKWGTAAFIEFSIDELLEYLKSSGWIIEQTWTGENRYNGSENSMLKTKYQLVGWTARRA